MNNAELLEAFRTASNHLFLTPLMSEEDFNRFGVDYGEDALDELESWVEDGSDNQNKLIFTGHRGCGKSTLLSTLSRQLSDRYFTVFFSIADMIERSDINHVNILFAIAVQLLDTAEERHVKISASTKKDLYRWLGTYTKTETSTLEADLAAEMEGKVSTGILPSIFKFFAAIKSKLRANAIIREEIKTEFAPRISDLIEKIDAIADLIQAEWHRPILVIIDDLDKLDLADAETIFCNNIKPLFQPNFRIIYTIPIVALRDLKLRNAIRAETNQIQKFRVAQFFQRDSIYDANPSVFEDKVEVFLEILQRRISNELIDPAIARDIVLNSGGVLREAMRLADRCCSKCLIRLRRIIRKEGKDSPASPLKIDQTVFEEAITDSQIELSEPLGQSDYDLLLGIYKEFTPQDSEEQRFLDLLHLLYILEYRKQAQLWYGLNPLVLKLLKAQGYLP